MFIKITYALLIASVVGFVGLLSYKSIGNRLEEAINVDVDGYSLKKPFHIPCVCGNQMEFTVDDEFDGAPMYRCSSCGATHKLKRFTQ